MNILHLNTSDINGGAARAASRLHQALIQEGVASRMLVQVKTGDAPTVTGPESPAERVMSRIRPDLDQLPLRCYSRRGKTLFHPAWVPSRALTKINQINPDVVHLHWVNGGFLRVEDIARIKQPVVWSLHDMWAFTGGCHYDDGCGKYLTACEACPILKARKKTDLSARIFKRKQRAFSDVSEVTVVGISRWLCDAARNSTLFRNKRIVNIPNPISPDHFRPVEKQQARDMLGLPTDKKIVLFGAHYVLVEPRKGFSLFCQALKGVKTKDVEIAVFGAGRPLAGDVFSFPAHYLGVLHDDLSLRVIYSAADVIVVPSLQENLSNIIMESLACGTPVVGFRIGGNPDMIDHKQNGYLADNLDPAELARGIEWVLEHPAPATLSQKARQKVIDNFSARQVAGRFLKLYEQLTGANS